MGCLLHTEDRLKDMRKVLKVEVGETHARSESNETIIRWLLVNNSPVLKNTAVAASLTGFAIFGTNFYSLCIIKTLYRYAGHV